MLNVWVNSLYVTLAHYVIFLDFLGVINIMETGFGVQRLRNGCRVYLH